MEVTELSLKNKNKRNNSPLLPSNLRGHIIGKSNCGKSVLLFNLLLKKGWLDYNNLLVFGNSLHQPEYELIKRDLNMDYKKRNSRGISRKKSVRGCGENCRENGGENGGAHCRVL